MASVAGKRTEGFDEIIKCITRGDGIFITSHGGPLSIRIDTAGQPSIGVVPHNILLVFHTPMQAVVHSNTIQDTENMRFYSQANFFKTGMQPGSTITGTPENCYGADRYVDPNIAEPIISPEEIEEEKEKRKKEEAKKEEEEARKMAEARGDDADDESSSDDESDDESDEEREVRFIFQTARLRLNAMAPDSEQNCPRELLYLDEEEISNDEDDEDDDDEDDGDADDEDEEDNGSDMDISDSDSDSDSDDDDYQQDWKNFITRGNTSTADYGFELLNHIQVFVGSGDPENPGAGDRYYSQNQAFDDDSMDFDGYLIPAPRQDYRVPDGDRTATTLGELVEQFKDETIPYPLVQYEGDDIKIAYTKQNGETGLRQVYHAGARRHPYFNRAMFGFSHMNYNTSPPSKDPGNPLAGKTIAEGAPAALPRTTDQMLQFLSQKHTASGKEGYLLVVVNSCSPSKSISTYMKTELQQLIGQDDILSGRRQSQMHRMIENLKQRNSCYWRGRANFSRIRGGIPWVTPAGESASYPTTAPVRPNPLLPHWEGGNSQFTRIDKEDRGFTHRFIGELIAMEREHRLKSLEAGVENPPPLYFNDHTLFCALFTIASCDRRGTIMIHLRQALSKFFGQDWWIGHVKMWRDMAKTQFEGVPLWIGGAKKKRKKKTKRKRKKNRKKRTRRRKK